MKKVFKLGASLMVCSALVALFPSCSSDSESIKSYNMNVTCQLPEGLTIDDVSNLQLIIASASKSDTLQISDLAAKSCTLTQGQYKLSLTGKLKEEAQAYLNGSATVDLYGDKTVEIAAEKIVRSSLVFKTIYTTGSKQYYMKESYFEIVNNSDEVQYLDNLIVSAPMGNQTAENAWQANNMANLYACGQGSVIAFPGSGKDYPLAPGQSVLVANDATNHTLAYGNDESQKADYANCPDLSNADFEVYLDYNANDVDYPAPNMKVIFYNNKYMFAFGLGVSGRSFLLAKLPEGMTPEAYAANAENVMNEPGSSSTYMSYLVIPSKYVLDAVDTYSPDNTEHYCTFLPKDDATGVKTNAMYSARCLRRKVTKIENGRPYYQDTNSSADDFVNNQPLTPGVTPTTADL